MKKIEVKIKQKDKGGNDLSLYDLLHGDLNFLYKDTVAHSTKTDLQFFIFLYFIVIKIGDATFLEKILDAGLPRFNKLNEAFLAKKSYLRGGDYRKLVEEHDLSELFLNDIFFILIETILRADDIKARYASFLKKEPEIEKAVNTLAATYAPKLERSFKKFQTKRIQNDRTDDSGNTHDLSMSVYRTVRMRNSRNLDLNLQKYTSVRVLTSQSPIELTFFQYIDSQIIFALWDKFHVAEYARSIASQAVTQVPNHIDFNVNLGDLINAWLIYKLIPGKERRRKNVARKEFESAKRKNEAALDDLTARLVESVLRANERLEREIEQLKTRQRELSNKDVGMQDKDEIKKLETRIAQLENLEVSAEFLGDIEK